MKRKIRRKIKNVIEGTIGGIIGIAVIYGVTPFLSRGDLTPKDFQKVEWIESYNQNGRIYSAYKSEQIPHNQPNWWGYMKEVKKINNGKLEGLILLPDLDGDGKVGK